MIFSSFLKDTQKHLEETIKYYGPGHFDFRCYGTITILLNKFNILPDIHKILTENNYDEFCKDILVFLKETSSPTSICSHYLRKRIDDILKEYRVSLPDYWDNFL